jgi:uncharacterized LabA/DUF88 family protein
MTTTSSASARFRVRIFVDFWNFTLAMKDHDPAFLVAWEKLGPVLARETGKLINSNVPAHYEGMHVYGSYDPGKPNDAKLKSWFTNKLDKLPGISVVLRERQRKRNYPKCPQCQEEMKSCGVCNADMRGTEEKGVDTRIATDLIRLAWEDGYDAAVLISADRDFVPVAEFLQSKAIKVIHGSFPPGGSELTQKCWGNLNLLKLKGEFSRTNQSILRLPSIKRPRS